MREQIRAVAEAQDRSMNSEIIRRLTAAEELESARSQLAAALEGQRALTKAASTYEVQLSLLASYVRMTATELMVELDQPGKAAASRKRLRMLIGIAEKIAMATPETATTLTETLARMSVRDGSR